MKKFFTALILILTLIMDSYVPLKSGGPLIVTEKGEILTYGNNPLVYRYDRGSIGKLSNSEAIELFDPVIQNWAQVETTRVALERDNPGLLSTDINETNFQTIFDSPTEHGFTPIIFDADGAIVDAILGAGSKSLILGFSAPTWFITHADGTTNLDESEALFNGIFLNGIDTEADPELTSDEFKHTILHEFGHSVGLDHTQINVEALQKGSPKSLKETVPVMFPYNVNRTAHSPLRDDKSSISLLYPNTARLTNYGEIQGSLFKLNGETPIYGANIIARNINNPLLEAVSCISGYAGTSSAFKLFALPPGDYRLEVEPINPSFIGASSVGLFAEDSADLSFQDPVVKGYYLGSSQPTTQDINQALTITINLGQAITNIKILSATVSDNTSTSSSGEPDTSSSSSSTSSTSGVLPISNGTEPLCQNCLAGTVPQCGVGIPFCPYGQLTCKSVFGTCQAVCQEEFGFDPDSDFCGYYPSSSSGSFSSTSTTGGPPPSNGTVPSCQSCQSDVLPQCTVGLPYCPEGTGRPTCKVIFGNCQSVCNDGFSSDPDLDYCGSQNVSSSSSSGTSLPPNDLPPVNNGTRPLCQNCLAGTLPQCAAGLPYCPDGAGRLTCKVIFGSCQSVCHDGFSLDPDLDYCGSPGGSSSTSSSSSGGTSSPPANNGTEPYCKNCKESTLPQCAIGSPHCPGGRGKPRCKVIFGICQSVCNDGLSSDPDLDYCGGTNNSLKSHHHALVSNIIPYCQGRNIKCDTGIPACPDNNTPVCGSSLGLTQDLADPGCIDQARTSFDYRSAFCSPSPQRNFSDAMVISCNKQKLCPRYRKRFEACREDQLSCSCVCPPALNNHSHTPRCNKKGEVVCSGGLHPDCLDSTNTPFCNDRKPICRKKDTGIINLLDSVDCK